MRKYTTSYTDHPQELINIVTGVANKTCKVRHQNKVPFLLGYISAYKTEITSKDNKHIFYVQRVKNFPSCLFRRRHGSTNSCNVCVVPCIIVNNDSTISHSSSLVPIVPPRCNLKNTARISVSECLRLVSRCYVSGQSLLADTISCYLGY